MNISYNLFVIQMYKKKIERNGLDQFIFEERVLLVDVYEIQNCTYFDLLTTTFNFANIQLIFGLYL